MAKLYPPVIEGTIPAFNGATLVVPFSMNRSVSKSQISGFALKIKTIQSNTYITTLHNGSLSDDESCAIFTLFEDTDEITGEPILRWAEDADVIKPGQFYKAQLAYISNQQEGYYSTVGIVKYANIAFDALQLLSGSINLLENQSTMYSFRHTYTGVYNYANDPMEKAYTYRFVLYNEAGDIIEDSGELLHNAADDVLNTAVDTYTFIDDLEKNSICYLQYTVTTVNGLIISTPRVAIMAAEEFTQDLNVELVAESSFDNGYVSLHIVGDENTILTGKFRLYRQDIRYPLRWEPVRSFVIQNEVAKNIVPWKDLTVEHGNTYRYKLCQFNDSDILALVATSQDIYVDFEDMFLFDGERQLKIQYNPKVSSFKNDILESKLDTIGSKYPFFFRNGVVHYKEFPISGLISYWSDNEELFKPLHALGIDSGNEVRNFTSTPEVLPNNMKTTDLVNYNIAAERQFKLDVLEWLTNGKPKLFRSPAEGNYIVRLLNTSLTPTDSLGRMLHTFTSTAYEIDDCTYSNLGAYGFISGEDIFNNNQQLRFRTLKLGALPEACEMDANGYIELLIDPYGAHKKLTAQSILIEDCSYPSTFLINGEEIEIGATHSYNIDNLFEITSVKFKPSEVANYEMVQVTYSYYDTFTSSTLFDNITDVVVGSEPARQFDGVIWEGQNLVTGLSNIKRRIASYSQIVIEKKPMETLYAKIDLIANNYTSTFEYGFNNQQLNDLFTFDKRGASGSLTTAEVVRGLPEFYIYHIKPMMVNSSQTLSELRNYRDAVIRASIRVDRKDNIVERLYNDTAEEIIEYLSGGDKALRSEEIRAVQNFKANQNRSLLTSGFAAHAYILTEDHERVANKHYYIKLDTSEANSNTYDVYTEYFGDLPGEDEINDFVYEYGLVSVIPDTLYANLDNEAWDSSVYPDLYLWFDSTDSLHPFKVFVGNEYSMCAYINTGYISDIDMTDESIAEHCIDLTEAIQPIIYYDINNLTDLYLGNGLMATFSYSYFTTSYAFENQGNAHTWQRIYDISLETYNELVANYDDDTLDTIDPLDQEVILPIDGVDIRGMVWREWLPYAYQQYISAIEYQYNEWKVANGIDE